jgi:alpha-glutamyl/putrescinyl thymine pyrophosphorylase clade 1
MLVEYVKAIPPISRFFYWIKERHQIHLKRKVGKPKPWTDDKVIQTNFFTNPYRENDKVTVWFRENIREPLRNDPRVLFATVAFRWFNLPETADVLMASGHHTDYAWRSANLLRNWDANEALKRLRHQRDLKQQIFTGAYMINSPGGEKKLEAIIRRVNKVWERRDELLSDLVSGPTALEWAHGCLTDFDGMGGFMAYEVVCDLRHTYLLEHATDKTTWCNPGPGAVRGLYRILGREFEKGNNSTSPPVPTDFLTQCARLLALSQKMLPHMPAFEMREIEHSLCEWDKYERVLWGDGKSKRTFKGV